MAGAYSGTKALARIAGLVLGLAFLGAGPATAANVALGKAVVDEKIKCGLCHGWAFNGLADDPRSPAGPSLRSTILTREQLIEVIKCSRPGSLMPYFDARAYKDDRCYGVTAEDLGEDVPPFRGTALIGRQIEAVVDYLEANVIGRGAVTFEECVEHFGGPSGCDRYPTAAEIAAEEQPAN